MPVEEIMLPTEQTLTFAYCPDLLHGVVTIQGKAFAPKKEQWNDTLYQPVPFINYHEISFTAIPYYAWANRGKGAMTVWLNAW